MEEYFDAIIQIGSNLGDKFAILNTAKNSISDQLGFINKASSIYRSEAWGKKDQPDFLNQLLLIKTNLSPSELLMKALKIENDLGRERKEVWGPRVIDIDIIFYEDRIINEPHLIIPHPRMHLRQFVLQPMAEIVPAWNHPIFNKSVIELVDLCPDPLKVEKIKESTKKTNIQT